MALGQLFLIFQAARSGSDWLISLIDSHPDVCVPYGRLPKAADTSKDHHTLIDRLGVAALIAGGSDVGAEFAAAAAARVAHPRKKDATACSTFGWKQNLWIEGGTPAARATFARWVRDADVRLVLLRRDSVAWAVSMERHLTNATSMAEFSTGRNMHCETTACADQMHAIRVRVDPVKIRHRLEHGARNWAAMLEWARASIPAAQFHLLDYDDLVADTAAAMNATYRFLGVDPIPATSDYRMTSGSLADSVENLDEVRAELVGTPWAM